MNNLQIEEALSTSNEAVKPLLSTILNMSVWNESNEKVIVNGINKLLSVAKNRLQGVELLNLIINDCSSVIISENGIAWISHCLIKYPGDNLKELKLATIGKIVKSSSYEQEFNKRFVSEYISRVFETCLSTHANYHETIEALETLTICLKQYGSWFSPHKLRIESFITNLLDNSSEQVIQTAAAGFHHLQQVGGSGIEGINHKTNFSSNFHKLCATVHKLFDGFFENEIEIDQSDKSSQETFEFPDLPHYTQKMLDISARRIRNCLKFISTMLLKGFPVEKEIKPDDVLDLISRGSAIHHCLSTQNNNSLEDFQFCVLLNQIQIDLLQLLHGLIIWLHANSLPFTFSITKILVDCLNKTQSCSCFKANSCYQETVYKVLGCWIRVAKGAVHPHFQTQLVKCILKDITPLKTDVTLNMQSEILKNKSKKAIQKAIQERIISSGQGNRLTEKLTNTGKLNREMNCIFALDTLKHLLVGTILKLPPNILQELYTSVISTLIDLQTSNIRHPYTNPECEVNLYEVLTAFYEQDTLKVLPPLQLAIQILSTGVNANNRRISLTCEHGLNILEKICQPVCPSLFISENASVKQVIEKSSPFDTKVVKEVLEEDIEEDVVDKSDNQESEKNASNVPEIEVGIVEEDLEMTVNGEITESSIESNTVLKQEESIHIIDVQIIKVSPSMEEPVESINNENSANNDQPILTENTEAQCTDLHLKSEILSNIENHQCEINAEPKTDEEPPSKKIRIEEELNVTENDVKKEVSLLNLRDDIFEEDDFVDAVKDY